MTLTVIIPTLNSGASLPATLAALGRRDQVLIADGGSTDNTAEVGRARNARVVQARRGRGNQLCAAAAMAETEWLLFLHSDTLLKNGWRDETEAFMAVPHNAERAAVFGFALDDASTKARRLERWVAWRVRNLGLAYGDQGLLIRKPFYEALGGFRPIPLMEDVDLIRRIERRRLVVLQTRALTSAARWCRDGWLRRSARNLGCLTLYFLGVPPRLILRLYG